MVLVPSRQQWGESSQKVTYHPFLCAVARQHQLHQLRVAVRGTQDLLIAVSGRLVGGRIVSTNWRLGAGTSRQKRSWPALGFGVTGRQQRNKGVLVAAD